VAPGCVVDLLYVTLQVAPGQAAGWPGESRAPGHFSWVPAALPASASRPMAMQHCNSTVTGDGHSNSDSVTRTCGPCVAASVRLVLVCGLRDVLPFPPPVVT
jgi:hypothetical protein